MVDSVLVAVAVLQLSRQALLKWEFMALALVFAMLSVWGSRNAIVRAAAIREEKTQATDCLVVATYAEPRTDDTPLSPLSPLCLHPDSLPGSTACGMCAIPGATGAENCRPPWILGCG